MKNPVTLADLPRVAMDVMTLVTERSTGATWLLAGWGPEEEPERSRFIRLEPTSDNPTTDTERLVGYADRGDYRIDDVARLTRDVIRHAGYLGETITKLTRLAAELAEYGRPLND